MALQVFIEKPAEKALQKAPKQVQAKAFQWIQLVQHAGLQAVRRLPGFHDEALKGQRSGQRSIRLNRQWRLIYKVTASASLTLLILEVTPYDY